MTSSNGKHEFLAPPENPGDLGSLGSYRVVSELGRGGMGFVFSAEDERLKRTVALKVMNKKVAATPHSRARFISEARAMAAVHHDNVATIFEVGEHAGTPFMAMEMLKGETLEEYKLKKERPGYEQIIRFAIETAQGLAAAHAQGIVHRDIKPANIWVEQDSERIKILDFGLALAQTAVDQLSGRGSVVGTPGYLSPEQARTEPLDDRSDLYSLGVVLYELATGKLPLRSSTVAGQLIAILAHKPQPIREVNDKIPKPLADLIHKLLRKEPRNRVRSAADLVEELKKVEVECESKSEVALAINKLQMGLQEVVSKKDGSDLAVQDAMIGAPIVGGDPFATLPDAPFESLPDASSSSGVTASPLTASPSGTMPAARPRPAAGKAQKKPQPASPLQKYWPIGVGAGVAAVVLLILGIYALSPSSDPESSTITTAKVTPKEPEDQSPPKTDTTPPKTNQSQANKSQANQSQANKNQQRAGKNKNQQKKPGNQQRKTDTPPKQQTTPKVAVNRPPTPNPQQMLTTSQETKVSPAPVVPEPSDPIPAPPTPSEFILISSVDGRGADSTVKRGSGIRNTLGTKPSLAIQTRGDTEIQHAYVRFDLTSVSPEQKAGGQGNRNKKAAKERKTGNVELILNSVDGSAQGANIRVYGADNVNSERWMEEGPWALSWIKSFSNETKENPDGLDSLPLLAEVSNVRLENNAVKISSPELGEFIRTTPLQTATLILAGGKGNQVIQFVSRDGDPGKVPILSVELLEP